MFLNVLANVDLKLLTVTELETLENQVRQELEARKAPPLSVEEMTLVREYKTVQAIKSYRNRTNLSLRDSKDAVLRYEAETSLASR